MKKTILIIGGGGREHALAWKLKRSPRVGKIYTAPGNAGTSSIGENVTIAATDILALANWAQNNKIDFTVVGSDDALALGVVDEFQKRGLKIWGPSKAASQIESSKAFAKKLMKKNNIPTAEFETFTDYQKALQYIEEKSTPIVIKVSGLALGKGVTVCKTLDEAQAALKTAMIDKAFGEAGSQIVIEEFLEGQEFSIHAFCDGKNFQLLPSSQDHKPIYNGGLGPNTGGMGTIAPVPWISEAMMSEVATTIVKPALDGLKNLGSPFVGLLYPGLMAINHPHLASPLKGEEFSVPLPEGEGSGEGAFKAIEFNARFGDPETQSYMRLLKTDLLDILEACVDGTIDKINIKWSKKSACCVVLTSGGYPGKYEKGKTITGIKEAEKMEEVIVFQAGTSIRNNQLVTNGGRVLGITAIADNLQTALNKAYAAVKLINFEGMHYRNDIGFQSLNVKGG